VHEMKGQGGMEECQLLERDGQTDGLVVLDLSVM